MLSISEFINNNQIDVRDYFTGLKKMRISEEAKNFEIQFFANRRKFQEKNINEWVSLNPLTIFGKYVQKNNPNNMIIVTTKNTDSAKVILQYHQIHPQNIYGNDEVRKAGSKGDLLNTILDKSSLKKMIFIDDATEHLNTVKNQNIQCYFADWGYGEKNNDYISYKI
jgi:phosphoglycolate phosphatase-like HAD superfamily hydrolase